jgi:hypothetical protein
MLLAAVMGHAIITRRSSSLAWGDRAVLLAALQNL